MELKVKWQQIENELMSAYKLLPENIIQSDYGYREKDFIFYIEANELLLAMEELDGVIEDNKSPCKEFWDHLIKAAELMNHDHKSKYEYIRNAT